MQKYRTCLYAAATASVVLMAGSSAAGAAPGARQARQVSPAGRSLAASPDARLWVKRYNGTGNNTDVAEAVAVSPSGKTVYVTGQSYGTAGVVDYATVAYKAATGARLWVRRYNGPTGSLSNVPSSVAVSPDGKKVFVTGTSIVGQFGDYATVAYNSATGAQLWAKHYNGPLNNDDEAAAVAVSHTSGTVYVTGFSWGKVGGADYATIAYNAATGHQQWLRRYDNGGTDEATSIAVSPTTGTVYVTGESFVPSPPSLDYGTVAYSATGRQLWVRHYAGPGNNTDDATSVAVNPSSGTVYVTGYSWGTSNTPDYATVAYTASGTGLWVRRYNGSANYYDKATSVAVSPATGTVFVTGYSTGVNTGADYATIAYSPAGKRLWIKRYNSPGNGTDKATSMALNITSGRVYVTGQVPGSQYATVAYDAAGTQRWVARSIGSVLYASSVAVSPTTGTVFVTGTNGGDYITIAYQG